MVVLKPIYAYNHRRVVAQVSGVPVTDVAYSSFEADDIAIPDVDPQGYDEGNRTRMSYNWAKRVGRVSPTGIWCYDVSGEIHFTMTLTKPYLLSLWSTGTANDITVNGSIHPSRTGPAYNGWTYYEFDLAANTTNPVLSGGTDIYVDEVRLYPAEAKMTTSTYNPTFGKTSECDVNNRITYYEYDVFGRLIEVRDEKRNLIKTYEYHYKTNP